jgi:hypothetical protein
MLTMRWSSALVPLLDLAKFEDDIQKRGLLKMQLLVAWSFSDREIWNMFIFTVVTIFATSSQWARHPFATQINGDIE